MCFFVRVNLLSLETDARPVSRARWPQLPVGMPGPYTAGLAFRGGGTGSCRPEREARTLPAAPQHTYRGRDMLGIEKVDHFGIRVSDKAVSIAFYERLGFRTLSDTGFEKGHPIIMQHPSGVVLNLLGPADMPYEKNILMDVNERYPGITHVSFKVDSIDTAMTFLAENGIPLSGQLSFKDLRAVFIRDPDRNVIELGAYAGEEPETRSGEDGLGGYQAHP